MRGVVVASLVFSSVLAACAHDTPPAPQAAPVAPVATTTPPADPPPAPRADGRLPVLATPSHYAVSLQVDPTQPRFQGRVAIDVDVPNATRFLVLHGRGITVSDASATAGGKTIHADATTRMTNGSVVPEEIVLAFAEALPVGKATVTVTYDAPFANDLAGLYRVKEGGRWYAFTQFESTSGRRAIPSFDEPAFKATWDIAIDAPNGMIAVANTAEASRVTTGASTRFTFGTTPPLSSYLVAFAVGDFDVRVGATSPVPIRLISAKGKSALGGQALDAAAGLVKTLGDWFDVPYPFPKLDIVAVPDFAAGAMENPGLITFREELLLQDPARPNVRAERYGALVLSHELAHIWFGDLVTMKWWNDVWLNESFATFMETRALDLWKPSYASELDETSEMERVMDLDALENARAVRQPVASTSEIEESFDPISYEKGRAVLAMIEHWTGPKAFQQGLRDYIHAHAWKNATADDLLTSLDHASGRDVSGMAATFLNRPGVPNVAITSSCANGKLTMALAQSAWRPLGVAAKSTDSAPWRIPVCVDQAGAKQASCTDLAQASGSLTADAPKCPTSAYPNASEAGYYRFSLGQDDVRALAKREASLDVASRVGLVSNVWAEVRAGTLPADVMLEVLAAFDHETDGHVLGQLVDTIRTLDSTLIDDATRPAFRAWVAKRMAPHAQALGWTTKPGENGELTILRPQVLEVLGLVARDPATLAEGERLAKKWLADSGSIDPNVAAVALRLASVHAGPSRLEELRAAAKNAKTPLDRIAALGAMTTFDDPAALSGAFDLFLTSEVKMQDSRYLFGRGVDSIYQRPAAARALFTWLQSHWDAAAQKLPSGRVGRLTEVLRSACTPDQRDAEVTFFTPRVKSLEGQARDFAESVERATSCGEQRTHSSDAIAHFFSKNGKHG